MLTTFTLMATVIHGGAGPSTCRSSKLIGFVNVTLIQLQPRPDRDLTDAQIAVDLRRCRACSARFCADHRLVSGSQPDHHVALPAFCSIARINLVVLPRPGGLAPVAVRGSDYGTSIFSPVLFIVCFTVAAWLLLVRDGVLPTLG